MNERLRKILPYGYRAYTGRILCDYHVDSLNAISSNINQFIGAGLPVPEYLINGSHNLFTGFSGSNESLGDYYE